MTHYRTRLPEHTCHAERTPWNVISELWALHARFAEHQLNNARAFCEAYMQALPTGGARPEDAEEYITDAVQRSLLFWDTMRQRGNNFEDHEAAGNPPVLTFAYEEVVDGATLPRPVNYALVRIVPPEGVQVDPDKRPFMIVDPRAGHGPGIGGFKPESQVGVALAAGHPVYFVIFKMHPVPDQTLQDVAAAEIHFLTWLARAHPKSDKPCVLGNCQGGWAIMAVAAAHPELTGPLVLSGAPLSYWAGASGKNPVRYLGGLMGGAWLAYFLSDLGNGEFDGANLVANFETLDPANSLWEKYYNLYSTIDTERDRFLSFERWWGGYMFLTAEEIRATLDNLFIGNKLSHGQISLSRDMNLDLRRIRQPIIIFCSQGDNITPPQQALNWIADLYQDEREIKAAGQTIVYMIHETSGHLGIFVSSAIVAHEHKEIAATLEQIEALPPGLYEMSIVQQGKQPGSFDVRLEERSIPQLLEEGGAPQHDEAEFKLVKQISEFNGQAYELLVSPWLRLMSNGISAKILREFHPLRVQHWAVSDLNPAFWLLPLAARQAEKYRQVISPENPFLKLERAQSLALNHALTVWRDWRDISSETLFYAVYGMLASTGFAKRLRGDGEYFSDEKARGEALVASIIDSAQKGSLPDAVMRMLLLLIHARGHLTRSEIDALQTRLRAHPEFTAISEDERRERMHRQAVMVAYQPELALTGLTQLLPTPETRRKAKAVLEELNGLEKGSQAAEKMWRRIQNVLDAPPAKGTVRPAEQVA